MNAYIPLLAISDGLIFLLLVGGFLSIGGLLFFIAHKQAKKRSAAFAQIAASLDMRFSEKSDGPIGLGLGGMSFFKKGRSKKITNLMRGAFADVDCLVFDYRFTTGSGKSSHTHNQTVVAFDIVGSKLPEFSSKPEHFFHKFANMLGFEDINFEEYPKFSKKYRLNGEDETSVRSIFNREVIELLENQTDKPWSVDGKDNWLVIYHPDKRVKPEDCSQFLLDATTLLNAMTLT